ncbi:hypothetical protein [Planctomyces sp. SH-PL62]|uniref:hypothetical protein n=1 Tax=Planctomyces sp. SH-PL62 TaxID=1636152 RepID=UPI00078BDC1B|nr:hypothetical protein [Planctomyces sp. SH-PL62]AMV38581.1 hypothetical protein VT85_14180 [Planctomyces sp. SH-PL62]
MDSPARRIETLAAEPPPLSNDPIGAPSPIDELLEGLRLDPEDCWDAFLGLESLDPEIRGPIVEELLKAPPSEGLTRLLHLLGASRDDLVRATVREALGTEKRGAPGSPRNGPTPAPGPKPGPPPGSTLPAVHLEPPRLVRSLATAVDGEGLGTVVVSGVRGGRATTAAFLCDVRRGILEVLGEAEEDFDAEIDLFERFPEIARGPLVEDVPELATGLLAGSLMLSGRETPPQVREWLDATLGRGFHAGAFLAAKPEWTSAAAEPAALAERSWRVLEACPGWLDRSLLTFDLAEEITVRERRAAADPLRDAGAYRFLFERRILHRLELYRRMLLWMAFFWDAADEPALSLAAGVLADQLGDPQYAVPAHPFTVALTTRSLHEAQRLLNTPADPRRR